MAENQNVEYKESWRDEYLKWVCGFANAQGGHIYIGVKDDGTVIGVPNSKKLLEDLPNKIRDTVGILVNVNLLLETDKEYIDIQVNPSSYPVNYHGEYYLRSGGTNQQLRGSMLTQFLMEKTGYHWDAVPVDSIGVDDLDNESLKIFRRESLKRHRMSEADLNVSNEELLERLDLMTDKKLKRAAVMLFYENPGKIITGYYVKIGKFGEGADLQYQDTLEGSLFYIADRVIDLIYTKYLKAAITYEHDVRYETYPFPRDGVREAVYNALVHNNFADSIPIQIRIEDEAMYISNSCILPKDWTAETLMQPHKSRPFNPAIAQAFYRAGYIEAWGRGIEKICEACRRYGTPDPEYKVLGDDLTVKFTALAMPKTSDSKTPKHQADVLGDKIIDELRQEPRLNQKELAERLSVSLPSIQRAMDKLKSKGRIVRKDGKRYGYWEVNEGKLEG